jgi:hypothetical protein
MVVCALTYEMIRKEWDLRRSAVNEVLTNVAVPDINAALLQTRQRLDEAYVKLQNGQDYAFALERQLGIKDRWVKGSPEYKHYQDEAHLLEYRSALDELERLVVQRLFELSKLGMSGTGKPLHSALLTVASLQSITQGINYVVKSAKHCSAVHKPSKPHSPATTCRLANSLHHGPHFPGKK